MATPLKDCKAALAKAQADLAAEQKKSTDLAAQLTDCKMKLAECESTEPAPTPTPTPPASVGKGIATPGDFALWPAADRTRYMDSMKAAGATWIRIGYDAGSLPQSRATATEARARGFKILACLMRYGSAISADAYAQHALNCINDGDAYEVGNEPNLLAASWAGYQPEAYAPVYNKVKATIKATRNVPVVSGGLSPAPNSTNTVDPADFLTRALAAGMVPDVVGWHPYSQPALPGDLTKSWSTWTKMKNHPTWGKYPIWLTEAGATSIVSQVPAGTIPDTFQAQWITEAFDTWGHDYELTTPIFVYTGRNSGTDPSADQQNYGLLRNDWSPKAAYQAFKNA